MLLKETPYPLHEFWGTELEREDLTCMARKQLSRRLTFKLTGLILFVLFFGSLGLLIACSFAQPWKCIQIHAPSHAEIPGEQFAIVYTNPGQALRDMLTGRTIGTVTDFERIFTANTRCVILEKSTSNARIFDSVAARELCAIPQVKCDLEHFSSPLFQDGSRIALPSQTGTLNVSDTTTGQLIATFKKPGPVYAVAYCPDIQHVLLRRMKNSWCVWNTSTQEDVELSATDDSIRFRCFTPDGKAVIMQGDKECGTWDLRTGQKLAALPIALWWNIKFSPDGTRALLAGETRAHVCDWTNGKDLFNVPAYSGAEYSVDGKRILGCSSGAVILWDASTGKEVGRINTVDGIEHAMFSPDGRDILTTSESCIARIYDTETLEEVDAPGGHIGKARYDHHTGRIIAWDGDCIAQSVWEKQNSPRRGRPVLVPLTLAFGALWFWRVLKWFRSVQTPQ